MNHGTLALFAAAFALAGSSVATAAPIAISPVNTVSTSARPVFQWLPAGDIEPDNSSYEVHVVGLRPEIVARAPRGAVSAPAEIDLPDDRTLRWYVRNVRPSGGSSNSARVSFQVVTPPVAPLFTRTPGTVTNQAAPVFQWSGKRESSRWTFFNSAGIPISSGLSSSASGTASPSAPTEGTYRFEVQQRNSLQIEGPPAVHEFRVDRTPPSAITLTISPAPPGLTPTIAWTGVEAGAVVSWRAKNAGGGTVDSRPNSTEAIAPLIPLAAGSYVFEANQVDAAGNAGPVVSQPFSVIAPPAPPAPAPQVNAGGPKLPRLNAKRLRPRAGAAVRSTRPVLRWRGGPRGTSVYNIQLFRVTNDGKTLVKALSRFPRSARFRPAAANRLTRGACYVWRVWPFMGSRFTKTPLGVSHFCVRRR